MFLHFNKLHVFNDNIGKYMRVKYHATVLHNLQVANGVNIYNLPDFPTVDTNINQFIVYTLA